MRDIDEKFPGGLSPSPPQNTAQMESDSTMQPHIGSVLLAGCHKCMEYEKYVCINKMESLSGTLINLRPASEVHVLPLPPFSQICKAINDSIVKIIRQGTAKFLACPLFITQRSYRRG